MSTVVVSRRGKERIERGHLWVYRSDVRKAATAAPGDVVAVRGPREERLGSAFYNPDSEITLRVVTTGEEPVDEPFWRGRLEAALGRREAFYPGSRTYRWIHGEADGVPSLIVDRYDDYLSVQTLSRGTERLKSLLVRICGELVAPRGIIERNDQKVRRLEGLPLTKSVLHGEVPAEVPVAWEGLELRVHLWEGQKTGLFLDQRENQLAASRYARGDALDVFSYDGGFALRLARTCEKVLAVDSSAEALNRLRVNAEANGLGNVETSAANAFDRLREFADQGASFDTIVLDPPAFAKNRAAVPQARRGYKEINLRALKILRPGGHLVTCSCSYHVSETDFLDILSTAAADAGARMVVVEKRTQSRDHPILLTMPETYYLKCLILRKI